MAKAKFSNTTDSPITPSGTCFAIAPSDTAGLPYVTKALYIGADGDVMVAPARSGAPVLFTNLVAGTVLDVTARAVWLTGTTASGLMGLA